MELREELAVGERKTVQGGVGTGIDGEGGGGR